tara:strand:- start:325 stop:852 length:528 start_codon:yes stop_codon:yes gene_type:complete
MGLRDYTAAERLNKMTVDIVDKSVTLSNGAAYTADDLMFIPTAIEVSKFDGQAVIIQSVAIIGETTGGNETGDFDIIVSDTNPVLTKSGPSAMAVNDPMSGNTSAHSTMSAVSGIINITNMIDVGDTAVIGSADNVGIVAKPASTSKSIYIFGIARSTDTWASPSMTIRLGIVRD